MPDKGRRADDGAWEWTLTKEDGKPLIIRHFAPDIEEPFYRPQGVNEPIRLYVGRFCMPETESEEYAYEGQVCLRWLPTPHIAAIGWRPARQSDYDGWRDSEDRMWELTPTLRIPKANHLPAPPDESILPRESGKFTRAVDNAIYPPEIGDGSKLTHITGLLPNGFDVHDGYGIVNPIDRRFLRRVRTKAKGGGWIVNFDGVNNESESWNALKEGSGYCITQYVNIQRENGDAFTAADVSDALNAIRYALALALGRQTEVVLPVGWVKYEPTWARWTAGRIDPYRDPGTWLDSMITSRQVGEVVGRFLENWSDELRRDTLLYATGYYVQALGQHAEISVASAISGLLLLGVSWFVEERKEYSRGEWRDLGAEGQIRAMLESPLCQVNTAVPPGFKYLEKVASRLRESAGPQKLDYDGLSCLIKMRNEILHPTRDRRTKWGYEEWVEAYLLAAHFLELSMLAYVGYRGKIHPRTAVVRMAGYVEDVPWLGC